MAGQPILVAVDGSEAARRAVNLALLLAQSLGREVVLAHVMSAPLPLPGTELVPDFHGLLEQFRRERGTTLLAEELARLPVADLRAKTALLDGEPASALAQAAEEHDALLVVAGRRGRGRVARVLLGSVSSRLVQICERPTLIVP
jgi:nucleotide-binding universal stress UspA family protein